jgi:hypothetical protein
LTDYRQRASDRKRHNKAFHGQESSLLIVSLFGPAGLI